MERTLILKEKCMKMLIIVLVGLFQCSSNFPVTADVESMPEAPHQSVEDTYFPAESPFPRGVFFHATPPSEKYTAVVGWMQAIDIDGRGTSSKVEVSMMRLHATINGEDVILFEDYFQKSLSAYNYYKLYSREPWFDHEVAFMPYTINSSGLVMNPGSNPNCVYHWWDYHRSLVSFKATLVWFEATVRITGDAGVQIGMDYWEDLNCSDCSDEAGASPWYGSSTSEWQHIIVGK